MRKIRGKHFERICCGEHGSFDTSAQRLAGRCTTKKIADAHYHTPSGFTLAQDTGYQGYRSDGVTIIQPMKKPKGKELTHEQKAQNKVRRST
ncbi:MAG: hypothetical protein LBL94_12090 [Prevotellaceae bacterium]|nr:hypothetical protein [Prevotellaceae bacterium]